MSFALSGSTITQSGTDANISGLSGIAGVTVTTISGRTIYNVGNRVLKVTGTLNHDNRIEEIWFGTGAPTPTVNVTGTYNIGTVVLYGSKESYTVGSPFTFTKTGGMSYKDYDCNIMCRASGTLNLYGCSIRLSGNRSLWYEIGAHGEIRETHIYIKTLGDTARVYLLSALTDIDGFYCYDLNAVNFNSEMVQLKNYIPYNCRLPFFYNGPNNAGPTLYVENFERYGNWSGDQQGQCAAKYIYQNKVEGADTLEVYCRGRPNDNDFVVELRKDILINTIDASGSPLPSVKFFSRDVNNGHRIDFWAGTPATDTVYVTDRTYAFTTDALGIGVDQDYLSAVSVANNIGSAYNYLANPRKPMTVDDRGESGIAKFAGIEYNKLITIVSVPLKYANKTTVTWTLFMDSSVIELDKSVTDAYTTLETPIKLYDRAKSFLYDNFVGETETIVSRAGDVIISGNSDVVINKTTSTTFAFDGSTVTLKADTFIGGIQTNGIVKLLNGASVQNGTYDCDLHVDISSSSTLTFNGVVVTGNVYNDSSFPLTINVGVGTTVTTLNPGTGNGQVNLVEAPKVLSITNLQDGSDVVILKAGTGVVLDSVDQQVGSVYDFTYFNVESVDIGIIKQGFVTIYQYGYQLPTVDSTMNIKQIPDRNYL